MADVVYLVGPQDTDELRYSLRSLRYVDHGQVWLAGHCPDWTTGVHHIDVPQDGEKRANTLRNLKAAIAHPDVSEPFMLWCDDFYAVQPVGQLPVMHHGSLQDTIAGAKGGYRRALTQALRYLHGRGIQRPLAFDAIHVPQWFEKSPLTEVLATGVAMYQTVYGNLHRTHPGMQVPNAKYPQGYTERAWVSTNSSAWQGPLGRHVRDTHPEPGPYERG
jgi:hypothetical protein